MSWGRMAERARKGREKNGVHWFVGRYVKHAPGEFAEKDWVEFLYRDFCRRWNFSLAVGFTYIFRRLVPWTKLVEKEIDGRKVTFWYDVLIRDITAENSDYSLQT